MRPCAVIRVIYCSLHKSLCAVIIFCSSEPSVHVLRSLRALRSLCARVIILGVPTVHCPVARPVLQPFVLCFAWRVCGGGGTMVVDIWLGSIPAAYGASQVAADLRAQGLDPENIRLHRRGPGQDDVLACHPRKLP